MTFNIRLALPTEYEAVDALVDDAYRHSYGPREHESTEPTRFSAIRGRDFSVWVAVDKETNALLGTITITRPGGKHLMEDAKDDELDFRLLAVAPEARHRGVGSALTLHVVNEARSHGYRRVFMKSAPNMLEAHRLYKRLGFVREPSRDGLWINGEKKFDLLAFSISTGQ
jgi:ribosomal protein S18 acetylase RimI-like enzyme